MYTQLMHFDIRQEISGRRDWLLKPPTLFQLAGSDHQRPEKLLVLQDHVLNYNVEVSLVGTLARKIVAAVETLTRS
jgi:hypothetical protein